MFAPFRAIAAVRPRASPGVLVAAAAGSIVFAATPFLVPALAADRGVALGTAGLYSTAQVAGFAATTFGAGRLLAPSKGMLRAALVAGAALGLLSALPVSFPVLLLIRVGAGVALGVVTWIAWADATRHERGIGDVAAIGPLAATVASPILAWITDTRGPGAVFVLLAVVTLVPVGFRVEVVPQPPVGRTVAASRSNRVLIAALAVMTFAGSALFVFAAGAGTRAGLSPLAVAMAFSANAFAGIVATRRSARRGRAWTWLTVIAGCAVVAGTVRLGIPFAAALAVWGYAFWMAVPAVFRLIEERALRPDERIGDAQSAMAVGRVVGPALGGAVLGAGRFTLLAAVAAAGVLASAAMVGAVERYRLSGGTT